MKKISSSVFLILISPLMFSKSVAYGSEEDFAVWRGVKIEADRTVFGKAEVEIQTGDGPEGLSPTKISVRFKGKEFVVPQDVLLKFIRIDLSTLRISSEHGYPQRGSGPFLYLKVRGMDGSSQQNFVLAFTSNGFDSVRLNAVK